jgi:hypothetical protein
LLLQRTLHGEQRFFFSTSYHPSSEKTQKKQAFGSWQLTTVSLL